jgi:alanyl aminopeptidase
MAERVPEALTEGGDAMRYSAWVRAQFGVRARAIGWRPQEGDDPDTRELRRALVPFVAVRGADALLAKEARELALRWPKESQAVPADVRRELLFAAAQTAGSDGGALFPHFTAAAKAATVAPDRRNLIRALGGFRDPALARRASSMILDGSFDAHESLLILEGQLENEATRHGALEWLGRNYDALAARGASDDFHALLGWASGGCSVKDRELLMATFAERASKIDGGPRSYAKALERVELCIAYRRIQEPALSRWLAATAVRK